jgi:hypothetical protein
VRLGENHGQNGSNQFVQPGMENPVRVAALHTPRQKLAKDSWSQPPAWLEGPVGTSVDFQKEVLCGVCAGRPIPAIFGTDINQRCRLRIFDSGADQVSLLEVCGYAFPQEPPHGFKLGL